MKQFKIPLVIAALFMLLFIFVGIHYSFGVYFNPLMEDFGWTKTTTSSVFSLYMFLYAFTQWFMGVMVDRYHYHKVIGTCAFLYCFSLVLVSLTTNLWQLYISFSVLSALGMGGIYVPSITVINKMLLQKRGVALGTVFMGPGFGMLVMSPVARLLIENFSWRFSYRIFALAGAITATIVVLILKNVFGERKLSKKESGPEGKPATERQLEGLSLREATRTLQLWILIGANFLFSAIAGMVIVHLVPYALALKLSGMVAAMALGLIGIGRVLGSLVVGWLSDKITAKRSLVICNFVLGMIMFALSLMNSQVHLYLLAILFGIVYAGAALLFPAITADLFGQKSAGAIYGSVNTGYAFGIMAGPLLGGIAYDSYGSYSAAFYSAVIITIITAILLLAFLRPLVRTEN